MKTGWVRVPKKVIEHVGKILDRPVVTRERIEKEIVPGRFESDKGAIYERIISGEGNVVPDEASLNRGQSDDEADGSEKKITRPLFAAKSDQTRTKIKTTRRNLVHEQDCEREAASLNKRASSRFAREDARSLELLYPVRGRKATRSPCWRRPTKRRSQPIAPEEWYRPFEHRKRCRRGSHLCYTVSCPS